MKILFFLLFSVSAYSTEYQPTPIKDIEMSCGNETDDGITWQYCISKYKHSNSRKVIYHFHGRNGNATWWNDSAYHTGKIHQEWLKNNHEVPTVISISFGKLFFLLTNKKRTGLRDLFINKVIKKVEEKLNYHVSSRNIMGISMGALNTFYLSLSNSHLFEKSAILCAHIPFISHHEGILKVLKYAYKNNISVKRAYLMYQFSKKFFPAHEDWELNSSLKLIEEMDPTKTPQIYITCGKKDDWGCMKVSENVAITINHLGGQAQWEPRDGGHCDMNHQAVAKFLID